MTKKYYSTNEYFLIDPITKEQIPYEGYVLVENNIPYTFDDKKELVIGNNYTTKINLPNGFEGGKKYTYTITVINNSIVIGNTSITSWGIGADNETLDAEIE